MQLFGTSGIRRIFNQDLLQLTLKVGLVIGTRYDNVIVGRDTRTSGSALSHSVMAGILTAGARCSDAGILPTPTLAFATREFKAGVMITASHNPPEYNGIKLLNPDGSAFSITQQNEIEDFIDNSAPINIQWEKIRSSKLNRTVIKKHLIRILQDFPESFNLKVVVDCGCGAANYISPYLLTEMGCEVIPINCYPNGIFPRDAEPIETNLSELMRTVKETGADLGIAHDGDADRMMAVDELGRFISGDKLLAVLAQESGAKEIVTTIDASMSKAVILTAGEGTRMHPLTYTRSKGMLPVANKPILEHIVIEMQKSGICEFVFIVGFHAEQISGYFGDGRKWGVNIRYQNQKEHLGTADALRYAEGLINENFLMANGDAIINHHDITNLTGRTGNVLGVIELQDVSSFGVIDVKEGQIVRICEKIQNPPSHMVNAGLYLFTPEIFEAIKKQPNQNVENSR